jgi:aerobic C4-dicarboxylate transport protein
VVPTGYSFNLDGTAIYLTMASLFIAEALGDPLSIGEQISLLLFMIIASKGAAGVTGAGLATLAGGLRAPARPARRRRPHRRHRPVHVRGARADQLRRQRRRHGAGRHLDRRLDRDQLDRVLAGEARSTSGGVTRSGRVGHRKCPIRSLR